ncbi:MAG: hypothetical protein KGM49_00820 [Sphingomonadales bacterium]|nr:hypothetical protein [Sphingomonadales bacterium]
MDDIDSLLTRMRDLPLDPRLGSIDDAVLAGLAPQGQSQISASALAMVAAASLGIGLAGSLAPAEPVHAASLFPLSEPVALAPSTLLDGR